MPAMSLPTFVDAVRASEFRAERIASASYAARAAVPPRPVPDDDGTVSLAEACDVLDRCRALAKQQRGEDAQWHACHGPGTCCGPEYHGTPRVNAVLFWNMVYVLEEFRALLNENTTGHPLSAATVLDALRGHAGARQARAHPLLVRVAALLDAETQ